MTEKEYNDEAKNVIEFIKSHRQVDEDLHNLASKDSISYLATEKCLKYWDMVLTSLQLDPIEVEAAKLQKVYEEGYKKGKTEFFNFDAPLVRAGGAVSRQAVHDAIDKWYMSDSDKSLLDVIRALPPVIPQAPIDAGRWLGCDDWYHRCSNCGEVFHFYQDDFPKWTCCPNCHTKMDIRDWLNRDL